MSHLLSRGSLILAAIILARALPTPAFAAYSYFQMTVSMMAAYAALGLGVTASRYFAEVGHERAGSPQPPLGTLCALSLLISGAASLLVFCLPAQWINVGLDMPRWLLASGVASLALGIIPGGAILGLERYRDATAISALYCVVMLLSTWWAARYQMPRTAMGAIVASALIQAIGQYAIAGRVVGWRRMFAGFGLRRADLRRVYWFAGPMMFVTLMAASGPWLVGRIILRGQGAEHAFALYSIGLQWFSLALLLPGMISRVVLPRLVRTVSAAQTDNQQLVRQGTLLAIGAAFGMTLLVVALGPWVNAVYGAKYELSRWFIAAYMGAAIFNAPANTLGNSIVARDGQWMWLGITIVWLLVMLVTATTSVNAGLESWSGAVAQAAGALVLGTFSLAICRRKRLL